MKTNLKIALIILVTAACGLLTCVNQDITTLGTGAELIGLKVGDITASAIPSPISANAWNAEIRSLYSEDFATLEFKREEDITSARIRPSLSRGAQAEWCVGNRTYCSDDFYDIRVPVSFESEEFIYIKVTSEDSAAVNYYRFSTRVFSWVTDLASISVNDREIKPGSAYSSYSNIPTSGLGELRITYPEAVSLKIEPKTYDPNAVVRFASAKGTAVPVFKDKNAALTFDDTDYLYVEVTAENTVDKVYYKFRVYVGRIVTIKNLIFNSSDNGSDPAKDIELFGTGIPKDTWNIVGPGEFATARSDQPAGGFNIKIVLDDPQAKYFYKVVPNVTNALVNESDYNNLKAPFANGAYLVIMVKGANTASNATNYYHIKVTLLAANIKTHPKSAWYYRADVASTGISEDGKKPVAPLTVEFDSSVNTTNFHYEWYEADSLYGIYGRHETDLDEKNNISTVNGGPDMYYYLVQPNVDQYGNTVPVGSYKACAWKVGTDSPSYTPRIDWEDVPIKKGGTSGKMPINPALSEYGDGYGANKVNFFSGATNEVRYYWVKVTDSSTGLSVTSDRAIILTETEPGMKHFIFDLSVLKKKNTVPFTKIRELYKIEFPKENYFPADFNPLDYKNIVAQAQFFLPDGRPWTQNWTHGDLHFGYDEGSEKGTLTWWQNNLGANSGAIPLHTPHSSLGGLTQIPDWVGVAPSGDPARGTPPNDSKTGKLPIGYRPEGYPTGQAQGYFCGFIELLELRFLTDKP